jgi:hypothetical protein
VTHTPTTNIPSFLPHRRYARLNARTAVLGVKGYSTMDFSINGITASNLGHCEEYGKADPMFTYQKYLLLVMVKGFGRFLRKNLLSRLRNEIMGLVVC